MRLRLSRNALKLKVATRIPAQLVAGTGVAITKVNGVYTFDMDEQEIEDIATAAALAALTIGVNVQAYDADLDALAANSTDGLWAHTGAGTGAARTITGTANQITVTNGNGVSGNPTISIPSNAALPGSPTTTTQSAADNSTKIATTAYVDAAAAFPSGTVVLFYQANAPTGWTKITTQNDKALRVVSGTGGVAGGTNAFSTVMAQTVVGSTTLTTSQIPSHTHGIVGSSGSGGGIAVVNGGAGGFSQDNVTGSAGTGGSHNHTITMAIQYIDIILASKN